MVVKMNQTVLRGNITLSYHDIDRNHPPNHTDARLGDLMEIYCRVHLV